MKGHKPIFISLEGIAILLMVGTAFAICTIGAIVYGIYRFLGA